MPTDVQSDSLSLQQQAHSNLRQRIIFSHYRPGERISVKELCESLGVGRTPIRESLVRLQQEGLVRAIPQSGTYVSKIDLHSAECARFVREHLEQEVAIECCAKADDADIAHIDRVIKLQESAMEERSRADFFASDNLLHQALFDIAGRREVWDWLQTINTNLERYRWLRVLTEELDWDTIMTQHYKLRDAIVGRNPYEAGYLVTLHLHMMFDDQAAVIREHPDYFENEGDAK